MLTLYTGATTAVPLQVDDYYVKELASGLDELCFSISIWDPLYASIQEEARIRENSELGPEIDYLVKAIDGGQNSASVKAQIDLDDWKATMTMDYNSGSEAVGTIVAAVAPTGWTVTDNSGMTYKRTIKLDAATPLDVLEACRSTFSGVTFRFNNVLKTVEIVDMYGGQNVGAFATRDLNLKKNDYKGKSTSFATRLYAYGKDGLSFADINGGKAYVENHTYSSRVICAPVWIDERYTVKANLLADAQARLDAMAVPQRSFDCDVVDLASIDPNKYSWLSFSLFSIVGLIDQTRSGTKINHMVAERWRYPFHPEKNKVVLSTVAPRIQSQVSQIVNAIYNVNSDYNQQTAATMNALTAAILGAQGGAVRLLDTDDDGVPDTLYIADNPDPAQAVNVWRFNYQGWGASSNGYAGPFVLGADFTNGGTLYANNLKVTNINGENILDKTLGNAPLKDGAVIERTLGSRSVTNGKMGLLSVSNDILQGGSVSYGKTSFTGTLDQVGINKADIATINGYFTGSANFSSLNASNFFLGGKQHVNNSVTIGGNNYRLVTWQG